MSTVTSPESAPARSGALLPGLLSAVRPRQWLKNVLVLAAPLASGLLGTADVLLGSILAFVAFSLAASGIYLINDVHDIEADRAHPKKRFRAIAAGIVPPSVAVAVAIVLFAGALAVAAVASWPLVIVVAVYEAVQLSYCFWLKHQPVIDICIVSSGFLMRAIAGGAASGIPLSQWFLLVAGFGSLFMVSGKRYAEFVMAEQTGAQIRRSLHGYSASYLRFVWTASAALLIMTYALWSFQMRQVSGSVWPVISMVPFVVAVLRYAVDVDGGKAGEPEEIALSDRVLQILGVAWLAALAAGVYF
ncbi:MAG: decaprenyl-phosphate phosphoribosyltransferase [Labedaea sp.]